MYIQEGGLLEIPVSLTQPIKKDDLIGMVKNPFGDILKKYYAPEDGIVIGKSTNPVNMNGGRIIHLGSWKLKIKVTIQHRFDKPVAIAKEGYKVC